MSARSRQTVLALGLAGLLIEAVASHPAFAVAKVTLFKVITPKDEIVIGLTKAELSQIGKTAEALAKVLRDNGELQVWQYQERVGTSGTTEEAPVRKISIAADPETRIEAFATPLKILPVSDEIMIEAIR